MRVYLTGGSGYIGGVLARRLIERGDEVVCLVRATSDRATLEALGARCVVGDLTDPADLGEGMEGADWVVHAAAELHFAAPEERMREVNARGSAAIAERASALGVPALLNISSMATFGGSPVDGSPGDETTPALEPLPSKYARTKREGEHAIDARAAASGGTVRVVHVHPSLVYGPPGKRHGSNAMLHQMVRGKLPAIVGGDRWLSWVHVDDVAEAILRILDRAECRERYLLAGDSIRIADLVARVSELAGVSPPRLRLSPRVAKMLLGVLGRISKRGGLPVARENFENLRRHWRFRDEAARADLDWSPRALESTLPEIVEWLHTLD